MRVGITGHQQLGDRDVRIAKGIEDVLSQVDNLIGITSLALGADQLFAQIVIELGGALEVVIPSARYESTFSPDARARYLQLLSRAATQQTLAFASPSEHAFFEAGKAIARTADLMVAVWDGEPAGGVGGTADVVRYAEELGRPVVVIW